LRLWWNAIPRARKFRSGFRAALRSPETAAELPGGHESEFTCADVFVQQKAAWGRFLHPPVARDGSCFNSIAIRSRWIRQQENSAPGHIGPVVPLVSIRRKNICHRSTRVPPRRPRRKREIRLRESSDPFRSAGSRQSVPNHRRTADSSSTATSPAQHRSLRSQSFGGFR